MPEQDVGDDAHTPHVCSGGDLLVIDDLGCHELSRAPQHLQRLPRLLLAGQSEVDHLDLVAEIMHPQKGEES